MIDGAEFKKRLDQINREIDETDDPDRLKKLNEELRELRRQFDAAIK